MATVTSYACDRCGRTIDIGGVIKVTTGRTPSVDLCPPCNRQLLTWLHLTKPEQEACNQFFELTYQPKKGQIENAPTHVSSNKLVKNRR